MDNESRNRPVSAPRKRQRQNIALQRRTAPLIPALVAVGGACSLAAAPASALELGELTVHSTLGQPLRASIAYALAPNEQLANYCIYLRPGSATDVIPVLSRAQISVTNNTINLTGATVLREPMLSMQLAVDCPYTPHLLREYTIMLNPATREDPVVRSPAVAVTTATAPQRQDEARQSPAPVSPRQTTSTRKPAVSGSTYRVQPGDTASTIVARIENRSIGMWAGVALLLEANPDAFIDGDVNRIMAGKELRIPDMLGVAPVAAAEPTAPAVAPRNVATPAEPPATTPTVVEIPPAASVAVAPDTSAASADIAPVDDVSEVAVDASSGELDAALLPSDDTRQLQPGDVVLTPPPSTNDIIVSTETIIDDESAIRVVPVATDESSGGVGSGWNWLIWLGGAGVAIILGLLLFGRGLRERFGGTTPGVTEISGRRADDDPTQKTRVASDVDIRFEESVNSQAISLDADLGEGTGLQHASDIDVAEDYGFVGTASVAGDIDIEVPEEITAEIDVSPTDIIPPQHQSDVSGILTEEIPPESDDTEYDMSMIVDATKQTLGDDDDTATDLQAVRLEAADADDDEDGSYTLSQEADYQVLEQDYEDELMATQALNAEVQRAAEELAQRMEQVDDLDVTSELASAENTVEMPSRAETVEGPATEETNEMPAVSDPDNTAELTTNLPTTLEAENDADATGVSTATTVEMSAAGSDITVEMQVESGKVDTKKRR